MHAPFTFAGEVLTADDLANLRALANVIGTVRHEIAVEWSRRLMEIMPEYFPATDDVSREQLAAVNEAFLTLVLAEVQDGDLTGLYRSYYESTRQLIEADMQRAPARRISLASLYTSARVSLQVIAEHLAGHDALMLAYTKLTTQLMMLVGQAYSDAREDYLQRAFEQINTLSHELRAPLSHLFGYLELLRAGEFGPVSTEQGHVLNDLIHETDDLLWLMTGTLDLSRLDTGRVDVRLEEFALPTVFTEVVNSTPSHGTPVTWSVPEDVPPLFTDRVKIKQIISNLLRNAVRYGDGSPVALTAALASPAAVTVSIRDHGPGIQPADLEVIFDFLERGSGAGLTRDGYGIGLHVVRRLVQLLEGKIEVESAPGQGSCFRFTIPLRHPQTP